jgi:hypothetical protein
MSPAALSRREANRAAFRQFSAAGAAVLNDLHLLHGDQPATPRFREQP